MSGSIWIATRDLAKLAGIGRQAAHQALFLSCARDAFTWRGSRLVVRTVFGRGGKSGRRYEVRSDSLPVDLQLRIPRVQKAVEHAFNSSSKAVQAAEWWAHFLRDVLRHPKGSRDRRSAITALVGREIAGPDGKWFAPSLRDIERKVSKATAGGIQGLMRKRREVKPESRLILTKRWDTATAGLDEAERREIARKARQRIRDLWGGGAAYSVVQVLAGEYLADLTVAAGIGNDFAEVMAACELPKHLIEGGRSARRVHQHRTDIKAWDDQRPRVRLTSAGLAPMQLVYGDVHHFDVYVARTDGTLATPKGIAWLDAATRRIRIDIVLCEPGTAIRNVDLIDSFIAMTQDPHWGMPAMLYLDNGSEYGFAEFLPDALKLAGLDCRGGAGNPIKRADAYNAAAKGILEGSFRVLEQTILSAVPGYIGGDRMKARTANLGKAPDPFDGSFDEFAHDFRELLRFYNGKRQSGDLGGQSPEQVYAVAVSKGWQRTDVDPLALMTAFSIEATRKVVDGKISVGGELFYCDALARHIGERVSVRLPKYHFWPAVPVYTLKGELIGVARPDPIFSRLDPAGAEEAARRKSVARAAIAAEAADLNAIDVKQEMMASGRRQPPTPIPPSKGTIELDADRAEIGRRIMETPSAQRDRERAAKEAKIHAALERSRMLRGTP